MVKNEFYFTDADCIEFGNLTGHYIFIKRLFNGHYLFQCTCENKYCEKYFVAIEERVFCGKIVNLKIINTLENFILLYN